MIKLTIKTEIELRIMIAKTGKSLRQFSSDIGISHPYLSQILKGDKCPSATVANKIAEGLNKTIEDIFLIETVDRVTTNSGGDQ